MACRESRAPPGCGTSHGTAAAAVEEQEEAAEATPVKVQPADLLSNAELEGVPHRVLLCHRYSLCCSAASGASL